jgi:ferredoxin-type protein NapH
MTAQTETRPRNPGLGVVKSLLLALPILLLSFLFLAGGPPGEDPLPFIAAMITWLGLNTLFFLMLYTGKTYRYRLILFVVLALTLIITFAASILGTRGSLSLTDADMLQGKTPFCPLVIPTIIIPALFTRTIIFPGSLLTGFASISIMLVLWIGATLAVGRGWCSWLCFYGGLDEGCSRILKKPVIKTIDRRWTYLPWAVLLGVVLLSAITLSPAYCEWLCPFKAVTESAAVTSTLILIQTIIFVALFVGLVVVLPILTKRRTQCALFCPLGALQSLSNKINVFDVRIDPDKCSRCKQCIRSCSTLSLDEASLESGRTLMTCTKCGRCVDACPREAISFHIKGTRAGISANAARVLFLYPTFIIFAAFGGGIISSAILSILKLVTTGRMY